LHIALSRFAFILNQQLGQQSASQQNPALLMFAVQSDENDFHVMFAEVELTL
jgi:hypothetical protein